MIEAVVPPGVACAETFADLPDEPLTPEEEAFLARAVDKRRREFRTVRACARAALAQLGLTRPSMVPGERGAPVWPPRVVGSMTHCAGYQAAAVARDDHLAALGIDAEEHAPLPGGVVELVTSPAEREHLGQLAAADPTVSWDRLLFSAKESTYKAWFPLTGRWLGFEQAQLTMDPGRRTFTATLLDVLPADAAVVGGRIAGTWQVQGDLVLTSASVPFRGRPRRGQAGP